MTHGIKSTVVVAFLWMVLTACSTDSKTGEQPAGASGASGAGGTPTSSSGGSSTGGGGARAIGGSSSGGVRGSGGSPAGGSSGAHDASVPDSGSDSSAKTDSGADSGLPKGSCTVAAYGTCMDATRVLDVAAEKKRCTDYFGTWSDGTFCPSGKIGGCKRVDPNATEIWWHYSSGDVDNCAASTGGTWILP